MMGCHHFAVLLLITLCQVQADIPRLNDMNSFLGEPFTMTCPEGHSPFRWCVQLGYLFQWKVLLKPVNTTFKATRRVCPVYFEDISVERPFSLNQVWG